MSILTIHFLSKAKVCILSSIYQGEVAYIRIKEDREKSGNRSRSRSRSYTPRRSRGSPVYSPGNYSFIPS